MQNRIMVLGLALGTLATLGRPAAGQTEQVTLLASDGTGGDAFGIAVAVSGHTVVVGAKFDDQNGTDAGAAYVYGRGMRGWQQHAKLIGSDTAHSDLFGLMVAIDRDTIVVGAPNDHDNGSFSGSAYVFRRRAYGWTEEQKLIAPDGTPADRFGLSLAIAKDLLLVGAPLDQPAGPHSGSVYVYSRGGAGWVNTQKLVPAGHAAYERFGESVAISGHTLVLGAFGDAANGFHAGSAYVFVPNGSGFTQHQELLASDGATFDEFGISVAIDRHIIAIGAPGADQAGTDTGAAYIFSFDGTNWQQQQKLMASDAEPGDAFGHSVAVVDGRVAVGAYRRHADSGSAYVFVHDGTSWIEDARLATQGSTRGDQAGRSISMHGDSLVVGVHLDDELGYNSGSASVFPLGAPFTSFCPGDGSGSPCPCANESDAAGGRGCVNSTSKGASLTGLGSSSVLFDDATFGVMDLPGDELAILFAGDDLLRGGAGLPMGDGLRCAGGALTRFPAQVSNGIGEATFGPGLRAYGDWNPGDVRRFQVWYRDDSPNAPCGIGFNLSNALETTFTL